MNNTPTPKEALIRVAGLVVAVTGGYVFGRLVRKVTDGVVNKHA